MFRVRVFCLGFLCAFGAPIIGASGEETKSIVKAQVEKKATGDTQLYIKTTPPGADVSIKGTEGGRTPLLIVVPQETGTVTIQLQLEGMGPVQRTVQVQGGRITRLTLDLTGSPEKPAAFTNSIGMRFASIPAGEFLMGSAKPTRHELFELGISLRPGFSVEAELPQHRVSITHPYLLGITEVTQSQWHQVMGTKPWKAWSDTREGADYAVNCISWENATEFCRRLSKMEGRTYRLPTEAEWEYACRAGTATIFSFGDDPSDLGDYAWFEDNAYGVRERYAHAHEVANKRPNPWGLYDMHGNVYEWCADHFGPYDESDLVDPQGPATADKRVVRGGSWHDLAFHCRSAYRLGKAPTDTAPPSNYMHTQDVGFRVVLESVTERRQ